MGRRAKRAEVQRSLIFERRGGRRKGAGRKPKGERAMVTHATRPILTRHTPVLVTMKMKREVWNLRARRACTQIVRRLLKARERLGMRIVHFSVQRDHLHLLVEAENAEALARAIQGLSVRIARALNRLMGRTGSVFLDRYHARVLTKPREVRVVLRYVLCNGRKHGVLAREMRFDPCSSAAAFDGWIGGVARHADDEAADAVVPPKSWLLRIGWRRLGLIDPMEVPGPLPR